MAAHSVQTQKPEHTHSHSHAPIVSQENERKVLLCFFLVGCFMFIEFAGGLYSGSLALIADAGHMLTDTIALFLAWIAFRLGRRATDSQRTFGYLRFEVIASFLNALTLLGIVVWITYEAWQRFNTSPEIMAWPMLSVAIAGLIINLTVLAILSRGETERLNLRGVILHVMGDLLGSLGAIVAAIVIKLTGWAPIDPILSIAVALLIVRSTWKLFRQSLHILLEGAPAHITPQQIKDSLCQQIPGIKAVNHVHLWLLTSDRVLATLHLQLRDDNQAKTLSRQAEQILKHSFEIEHPTIAIDWQDDEEPSLCSLDHNESQCSQGNLSPPYHTHHGYTHE